MCLAHVEEAQGRVFGTTLLKADCAGRRKSPLVPGRVRVRPRAGRSKQDLIKTPSWSLAGQKGQAPTGSIGLCMDSASH